MSEDKPLYLPKGSVRAVIALAFTVTLCYLAMVGKIDSQRLIEIVMAIIGFYFGSKAGRES